jgi:hypothetical protein
MVLTAAEVLTERSRLNMELLQQLAIAVGTNEKTQRQFRNTVFVRLSRIETMLSLIRVAQLAHDQNPPMYDADKLQADAEMDEKYISEQSAKLSLTMLKYIYGETDQPAAPRRKRRKRSGE